jgi:hypothetical protein
MGIMDLLNEKDDDDKKIIVLTESEARTIIFALEFLRNSNRGMRGLSPAEYDIKEKLSKIINGW